MISDGTVSQDISLAKAQLLKTAVTPSLFPSLEMGLRELTPLTWFSRMSLSCNSSTDQTLAFRVKAL